MALKMALWMALLKNPILMQNFAIIHTNNLGIAKFKRIKYDMALHNSTYVAHMDRKMALQMITFIIIHWYSKSLSYTVLRTAVLSSTDFSKVPKSFVLHENLEQCEFLYIWIWVTRIFVLSNTILRVILSWIQMFWAARFLSYTDFPLSQKSCSSRSYCNNCLSMI